MTYPKIQNENKLPKFDDGERQVHSGWASVFVA
jgi:hypothetical protein